MLQTLRFADALAHRRRSQCQRRIEVFEPALHRAQHRRRRHCGAHHELHIPRDTGMLRHRHIEGRVRRRGGRILTHVIYDAYDAYPAGLFVIPAHYFLADGILPGEALRSHRPRDDRDIIARCRVAGFQKTSPQQRNVHHRKVACGDWHDVRILQICARHKLRSPMNGIQHVRCRASGRAAHRRRALHARRGLHNLQLAPQPRHTLLRRLVGTSRSVNVHQQKVVRSKPEIDLRLRPHLPHQQHRRDT